MPKKNLLAVAVIASLGARSFAVPSVYLNQVKDKRSYTAKSKGKLSKKERRK